MEEDLRARLTPVDPAAERRRLLRGFGVGLGAILLFFAWRQRSPALAAGAGASWLLAAVFPAAFGPVYSLWMPVVGVLARLNIWLVCGFLYYVVITPYALLLRLCGKRLLELGLREGDSYWKEKPARDPAESARRAY